MLPESANALSITPLAACGQFEVLGQPSEEARGRPQNRSTALVPWATAPVPLAKVTVPTTRPRAKLVPVCHNSDTGPVAVGPAGTRPYCGTATNQRGLRAGPAPHASPGRSATLGGRSPGPSGSNDLDIRDPTPAAITVPVARVGKSVETDTYW